MGSQTIPNPLGEESESAAIGETFLNVVNGDTVSLAIGTLVEMVTPYSGSGSITVKRSATAVDYLLVGIVAGQAIAVGAAGRVAVIGVTQVNMDGATTAGHVCIQSVTTAGQGHDAAAAVAGQTIGVILQTIAAAGLAYVFVTKV
jgi:hypothetical protein